MGNNQSNHFPHIPGKITWYWTRLTTVNHRPFLSDFFWGEGRSVHRLDVDGGNDLQTAFEREGKGREGERAWYWGIQTSKRWPIFYRFNPSPTLSSWAFDEKNWIQCFKKCSGKGSFSVSFSLNDRKAFLNNTGVPFNWSDTASLRCMYRPINNYWSRMSAEWIVHEAGGQMGYWLRGREA